MTTYQYRGCFTAIITPFTGDGAFDAKHFEILIDKQVEAGVDGIVVLGTTGESPTITPDEHDDIIRFAVKVVGGRTKVIAGTGSNATQEAIDHSIAAARAGADALLQVNPYYNKPTQLGLFAHFSAVADSVDLPIMLYNIKGRTGVNLETETLLKLTKHPNIVSIKEASGDLKQIEEVIKAVPDDFTVLAGDDGIAYDLCKLGGDGVVSVASNIVPKEMKKYIDACVNRDWPVADALRTKLDPLFKACFIESNPQPIKTLVAHEGLCEETFRLPMTNMEEENKKKLLEIYEDFKA